MTKDELQVALDEATEKIKSLETLTPLTIEGKSGEKDLDAKPVGASEQEVGAWYFKNHPEYKFKSVFVCPDGEVFPNNPKNPSGMNNALNYGFSKGFEPSEISR